MCIAWIRVICIWMLVGAASGCTTAAKRVFQEGRGAHSDLDVVPGTGGANFAEYDQVEILPPRSDLGGLVSSNFNSELVKALENQLAKAEDAPFRGSGSTLRIEPRVQWYHRGGVIFPDKYAVVLYLLGANGMDVSQILVTTKSEATRTGDRELAESNAEELRKYVQKHGKPKGK